MKLKLIVLILILFFSPAVKAHGGGCACSSFSGAGLAGPIVTIPAYTMPAGMTSLGLGFGYKNSGRLGSDQIKRLRNLEGHADDNYGSLVPSLNVNHGFTDRLTLGVNIPFNINWDFREAGHDGLEELGDSIGFGDITVLGRYQVIKMKQFQSALITGIKLPTGPTNIRSNTGERFEALNQPGSGSFDPLIGFAISKQVKRFGFDTNVLYKISTEGSQDTDLGDVLNYNFAISYAINHDHDDQFSHRHDEGHKRILLQKIFPEHIAGNHLTWDLILEANALWEEKPEISEVKDANHGGSVLKISPGLRMTVNDSWVYNLSLGFPVVQDLNGEQGGTDLQLFFGVATML